MHIHKSAIIKKGAGKNKSKDTGILNIVNGLNSPKSEAFWLEM